MEKLSESLIDLDLESKFYQIVPHESDDPDVWWHEQCSDVEEDRSSTQQSKSSYDYEKITDAAFKERHQNINDDTKFTCCNELPACSVNFEMADSSNTDDYYKEIVRNHRKSTFASSSLGLEKESDANHIMHSKKWEAVPNNKIISNMYPEVTQIFPVPAYNLSTVSDESTWRMQSFSVPTCTSPAFSSLNNGTSQTSPAPAQNNLDSTITSNSQRPAYISLKMEQQPPYCTRRITKFVSHPVSDSLTSEEESYSCHKVSRKRLKKKSRANHMLTTQNEVTPCYRNYQLLGDSQLLRFSEQILHFKPMLISTEGTVNRRLGYCVSGQKIQELEQRLLKKEFTLSDKLILLIGTNDMVYDTELKLMCDSFHSILNYLKNNAEQIVVLTIPPIPKLINDCKHMPKLKKFNQFLLSHSDEKKVFVIDLASVYISYSNTVSTQFFERKLGKKGSNSRKDLVHLNCAGFKLLKAILDIEYFDKFSSCK